MVRQIQGRYDVSERCACRFLGFERTALRYVPQRPLRDAPLRAKLRETSSGWKALLTPSWEKMFLRVPVDAHRRFADASVAGIAHELGRVEQVLVGGIVGDHASSLERPD